MGGSSSYMYGGGGMMNPLYSGGMGYGMSGNNMNQQPMIDPATGQPINPENQGYQFDLRRDLQATVGKADYYLILNRRVECLVGTRLWNDSDGTTRDGWMQIVSFNST